MGEPINSIHPVILGVEATEFTNQITARVSVFHGYGNVTEAYIAAFEAGTVDFSNESALETFMSTNLTNVVTTPVVIYDQHVLNTTIETGYTGLVVSANVDIDTDTQGYDIVLLAVGHKASTGARTRSFTFYKNDAASHPRTVSSLPAFISGTVEINNAFVEQKTVKGKRKKREVNAATPTIIANIDQFQVTSANVVYFPPENPNYAYMFGSTGDRPLTLYERLDFLARPENVIQSVNLGSGGTNFRGSVTINGTDFPVTLDSETDASADKTPWILVLNYIHQGGTNAAVNNPALNIRTTASGFPVLPLDGSLDFETVDINGSVPNGSAEDPDSWGHTGLDLFDKLCIALGSSSGNQNGVELRFVAKTNNHDRLINFKTDWNNMITEFRVGGQLSTNSWPSSTYTLLTNHDANLPVSSTHIFNEPIPTTGQEMTEFPYYGYRIHWGIRGQDLRWEVDDGSVTYSKNTYHQIWVRANAAGATGLSWGTGTSATEITADASASLVQVAYNTNTTIPTTPLLNVYDTVRDQVVPSWSVNTGYVYTVGTNSNDLANLTTDANARFNTQTAYIPVSDIPTNTMHTDACVTFGDTIHPNSQQYLRLLKQNKWALNPSTSSWTVAFWVKLLSTNTTDRYVFTMGDTAEFKIDPTSTGTITFSGLSFASTGITANDTWYHVALVRDSTGPSIKLYINNTEITSSGTVTLPSVTSFKIGNGNGANKYMPYTNLDDFVVFKDQALDANQLNSLYTQGAEYVYATDNYTDSTVTDTTAATIKPYAFWKFDQDGLLSDTSDNNHHLKQTGVNLGNAVITQETSGLKSDELSAFVEDPYIVIGNVTTTNTTIDVVEGSLFSSFADIERYHVFAFDTSNVAESLLTRANVVSFAETRMNTWTGDGHSNIDLPGITGNLVYSGSNIPRYGVELLNNKVYLTHAFNNLGSNEVVPVDSVNGTYKPYVYARDIDGRRVGTDGYIAPVTVGSSVPTVQPILVANIDIYFKNPSSTSGFVTSDSTTTLYLYLMEILLYSENNWSGDTIPYTVSYLDTSGNPEYIQRGTGTVKTMDVTTFTDGMQDGYAQWYRWNSTTYLTTSYKKLCTLVPNNQSVGSLKLYVGRVQYGADLKVVYTLVDGGTLVYEMPTLQKDPRFTNETGFYPTTGDPFVRDWNASIDLTSTIETYYNSPFNVVAASTVSPFGDSTIDYSGLSQATLDSIGTGWTQIKYLAGGSSTWFPGNDNLLGYGGKEFLFTTGDFSRWLICDQYQVNGEYYSNVGRIIKKSSISDTPYTSAGWYYRDPAVSPTTLEDPWIVWGLSGSVYTMMYGEDSDANHTSGIHSSGMYVFTR